MNYEYNVYNKVQNGEAILMTDLHILIYQTEDGEIKIQTRSVIRNFRITGEEGNK